MLLWIVPPVEGVELFSTVYGLLLVVHHAPLVEFSAQLGSFFVPVELGVVAEVTLGPTGPVDFSAPAALPIIF